MNQRQQELRRAAAREFCESLDDLQEMFRSNVKLVAQPEAQHYGQAVDTTPTESTALEQVVTDIEQFFQSQPSESTESKP